MINLAIVELFRIHLHVFVTSFKHRNDIAPSNIMTDVILQWHLTSASVQFPHAFKIVTLLFHITQFLAKAIYRLCVLEFICTLI